MTQEDSTWVWRSTEASRAAGQISLLAVAETVFAVSFYWWLAVWIGTAALLVISPIVAFMVLLRSPQSVAEGVRLADAYLAQKRPDGIKLIAALVLAALICGVALFFSKSFWHQAFEEYAILISLFLIAIFIVNIATCILSALLGPITTTDFSPSSRKKVDPFALMFAAVGIITGIAFRVLVIRMWSTLRFLKFGIRQFPLNWFHLTLKQDLSTPPDFCQGFRPPTNFISLRFLPN